MAHPGDLIGRLASAAICIQDPRVSEAHALLSLRGGLVLLALRGLVEVDRQRIADVRLKAGQRIRLAEGLEIAVLEVTLPPTVLTVEGPGLPPTRLPGTVACFVAPLAIRFEWVPDALASVWASGGEWFIRVGAGAPVPLRPGDRVETEGGALRFAEATLKAAATPPTDARARLYPSLRVEVDYESTRVSAEGGRVAVLTGAAGGLMYQLSRYEAAVHWKELASALWPDTADDELKQRWSFDKAKETLVDALVRVGLRPDLVRGSRGEYRIHLVDGDALVDRTA